jgi:AsmA protein
MNKTVKIITASLAVFIIVVLLIPVFISSDDVVNKLSEQVTESTGRTLIIEGEKSFSIFPSLTLQLQDVRFSNMKSGSKADMMTMKALEVHIPWMSIFSGELIIERFVIEQPDILLETDKQGRNNWQLLASTADSVDSESKQAATTQENQSTLPDNVDLSLGTIEVNGGQLTLIDHRNNSSTQVEQLDISLVLPSLRKNLALHGQLTYMGEAFTFDVNLDTPAKLINNQPVSVELAMTSSLLNMNYKGELLEAGNIIKGHLALETESVKNLLAWQKHSLTVKDNAFNQFSFNTDMMFSKNTLTLNKLDAKLDQLAFTGKSLLVLSSPPQVNLAIDLGVLDLNPYLADVAKETVQEDQENSDKESEAIVWDKTPLDLSALKQVNADIKLSSSKLIFREITLDENQLSLVLKNGNALLTLEKFNAYQGKGVGEVKLITAKKPYKIQSNFELKDIQANPLLKDAVGFDKLLGKGLVNWNISTQGVSQHDFVNYLDGKIGFNLSDGAVKGVNLAALARSAEGLLSGDMSKVSLDNNFDDAQATDFASFLANFTFNQGVGSTTDLALVNPFIRVSGKGKLDLPKTEIDFKVKTKLIASAAGQQATGKNSGITIPIKITGPFHKTKIRADVSSVTKDKIKDKLTDKLKGFFN